MGIVAAGIALGSSSSQAQTAGSLDTTFGSNGIVTTSLGSGVSGAPLGAFEESNGDILVVVQAFIASTPAGDGAVQILRYTPQGQLDTTFGTNGIVTTTIPNIFVQTAVAQDPEGRLVIAGKATNSSGATGLGVARLTPNGQLDTTFGTGGVTTTFLTNTLESVGAFLLQPNGQIVVAGSEISVVKRQPGTNVMARYDSNGSLDQAFGSEGIAVTAAEPESLALLANGDYLGVTGPSTMEFGPNGAPVSSFTSSTPTATSPFATIAVASSGDVVEAASVTPPGTQPSRGPRTSDVQVARFSENGTADSTFTTTTFPFVAINSTNSLNVNVNIPSGVAFQSTGQVIVAGGLSGTASGSVGMLAVARLNADGGLDTTFGTGGAVANSASTFAQILLVQRDGNIVVAGSPASSSSEVAPSIVLERFLGN